MLRHPSNDFPLFGGHSKDRNSKLLCYVKNSCKSDVIRASLNGLHGALGNACRERGFFERQPALCPSRTDETCKGAWIQHERIQGKGKGFDSTHSRLINTGLLVI